MGDEHKVLAYAVTRVAVTDGEAVRVCPDCWTAHPRYTAYPVYVVGEGETCALCGCLLTNLTCPRHTPKGGS